MFSSSTLELVPRGISDAFIRLSHLRVMGVDLAMAVLGLEGVEALVNIVFILGTTSTTVLVSTTELRGKLVHFDVGCWF